MFKKQEKIMENSKRMFKIASILRKNRFNSKTAKWFSKLILNGTLDNKDMLDFLEKDPHNNILLIIRDYKLENILKET